MKVAAIIPARMGSTRFPGKPLAKINGRPMIEHVYRRLLRSNMIDELYVATCDDEIATEVMKYEGKVIMTSSSHMRGTDRVAEAAQKIEADIIINVQGDEPMVNPIILDKAIAFMKIRKDIQCLNFIAPIKDWNSFISKNIVKVVLDRNNKILYFSRLPIPNCEKQNIKNTFKQIGIYLVYKELLLKYSKWDETPLEKAEKVDMLRFLENDIQIYAFLSKDMIGVDTPQDLLLVERLLLEEPLYRQIFVS